MPLVEELPAGRFEAAVPGLARVLHACVEDGASIGFVPPFPRADAERFWLGLGPQVRSGGRRIFVAHEGGAIVGAVTLVLDMPPNGRHRADLSKLIVDPHARGRGLGARLIAAAETAAREEGRTLVVLDTITGGTAERLYARLGYATCGTIPGYARSTAGVLEPTTVMYKELRGA